MKTILQLVWIGGYMAAATGLAAAADPKTSDAKSPPKTSSSLDDELFKDLDDGLGKPKTSAKPEKKPESKSTTAEKPVAQPENTAKPGAVTKPAAKPDAASKPAATTQPADDGAHPAEAKPLPKPANALDAELLKELEGPQAEKKKPKSEQKPSPGAGDKSDDDDPLVRLSRRIREAETRIRRSESGEQTQRLQREIVEDIEKLIAQIEQQQQRQKSQFKPGQGQPKPGSKPGQQQQPGQEKGKSGDEKPSTDSNENLREMAKKKADPGKLKNMLDEVWGMLPERQRQDVMQSSVDDFPAKYQYVIEEYFRMLLERRE
jgi:hypothetical protein